MKNVAGFPSAFFPYQPIGPFLIREPWGGRELIADILLGSIKRLAGEYEDTVVKMSRAEMDKDKF